MDTRELVAVVLRASIMYLYVQALMRLSGKRTLGSLSPIDFVITTMVGDFFDDVFWAEVPLAHGLVGVTTLVVLHMLVSFAASKSQFIDRLIEANRVPVISQGCIMDDNLRRERVPRSELLSLLREKQKDEEDIVEIKEAYLEPSAHLSITEREDARPAQKKDLAALRRLFP